MIRLSDAEKADLRTMAVCPEKQGVAITHNQLKALLIAQDERDGEGDAEEADRPIRGRRLMPYGRPQTRQQATRSQSIELTREAIKRQGQAKAFGNGPVGTTKPRRESLGIDSVGPINRRV